MSGTPYVLAATLKEEFPRVEKQQQSDMQEDLVLRLKRTGFRFMTLLLLTVTFLIFLPCR
jgi:hypothetical protein